MAEVVEPEIMLKDMLFQKDVAKHLNVSVRTLRRWHHEGIAPPSVDLNGVIRYPRSWLIRWAEAKREAA